MKKMMLLATLIAAMMVSSCASVEIVKDEKLHDQDVSFSGKTIGHVSAQNWGIYLFTIPLVTGSTAPIGKMEFFKDTVTPQCMMDAMTTVCKNEGATAVYDVTSQAGKWGLMIYCREINMSGNAVK